MPNFSARPTRPYLTWLAPGRGAAKGLGLASLTLASLLLGGCSQSPPSVGPDGAGSPAVDPNAPAGNKLPPGTETPKPSAGAPPGATMPKPPTGAPPVATAPATTGATGSPPASATPSGTTGGRRAYPEFVQKMIERFQSEPVTNPPRSVVRYAYKGDTVFFVPAPCCDFTSELYSSAGELLCAPDGGITGRGDGKCPDFMATRKDALSIWQDSRTMGKTPLPPKGGTSGTPKSTATLTPPTVPPKPLPTQ